MSLELVRKIMEESSGKSECVTLHAWGESILHPHCHDIIRQFKENGFKTHLSTNATMLNTKRQDQLLDSGLDFLVFSIDAMTEPTYSKLRAGGHFENTIRNVESFLEKAQKLNVKIFCVVQLVYTTINKEEAALFKKRWQQHGTYVWLKPYSTWSGEDESFMKYVPDKASKRKTTLCDWPWRQLVIHWNGNVAPCCNDYDGKVSLGNIAHETITDIWNGDKMKAFRASHLRGRQTIDFCKGCTYVSLGPFKQCAFVFLNYLSCMKLQTVFENYSRKLI